MNKDVYLDLYKDVEPILIEYGLSTNQAKDVFYSQMAKYETQLGDLKLPGVNEEDKMDVIKQRIPNPLTDKAFIDRVKKMRDE